MLILRAEAPFLSQVCWQLLVEGLADILRHHGQEFEGTDDMLVCEFRFVGRYTHCPLPPVATNKFL
jgi:hypothetical protein